MFDLLVYLGAKLHVKNMQGLTPLTLAAKLARRDVSVCVTQVCVNHVCVNHVCVCVTCVCVTYVTQVCVTHVCVNHICVCVLVSV